MKLIIAESRNRTPRFRVVPDIILLLLLDLPLELLLGLLEGLDDTFALKFGDGPQSRTHRDHTFQPEQGSQVAVWRDEPSLLLSLQSK